MPFAAKFVSLYRGSSTRLLVVDLPEAGLKPEASDGATDPV
jgi:hypothetical protein